MGGKEEAPTRPAPAKPLVHPHTYDPKASEANPPLILTKGDGFTVWDIDEKPYLDLMGGLWNVNVGHNRTEVKDAIIAQMDKLSYHNTFSGLANAPSVGPRVRPLCIGTRIGSR